ncbi:MAG: tetratricopeptide repeat protein [Chloroflexota bacterium]
MLKGITLTQREQDVLKLIANGLSDGEIAEALVLAVGTVKWYNRQIYSKLDVPNRTQALIQAQRLGLLSSEKPDVDQPVIYHNNLPAPVTRFIGRAAELTALRELLHTSRLLTMTGPPGTGKTRLALQVASEVLPIFKDGVFFVSLAPVHDPTLVLNSIAEALDVTESGKLTLRDALKQFLSSKHLLLVLDNFEHLLPASSLVSELLGAAPSLSIIVTSREILHLYGEYEFSVPPLQLPDLKMPTPPDAIRNYEAVQLFVQQAQAVEAKFVLDADNAAAVAAICVHLDGLPLAIELAAARAKIYAPPTLLVRLGSRLQALTDGPRDFPARQKTLRDTLAWSYDLLELDEKMLFARFGVFAGGWTLEDASAVCGDLATLDVPTGMESLLNKSLLGREKGSADEPRFMMLETMREYALEKLAEGGESDHMTERHARYFLALSEEAAATFSTANEGVWLTRLDFHHDDLRAAFRWSLMADESSETSFRFISNLARFLALKNHSSEARAWLSEALRLPGAGAGTKACADALQWVGEIGIIQCDYSGAQALFEKALLIYRESGDQRNTATSLISLGEVAMETGDYEIGAAYFQQGFTIMHEFGDLRGSARALTELGYGALRMGDFDRAQSFLEQGLERYQAVDDRFGTSQAYNGLGEIALRKGELDEANRVLEASLDIRRAINQKWGMAVSLGSIAWVAMMQQDYSRAIDILSESLALRTDIKDWGGIAWCLEKLAEMAHLRGKHTRAATIFGAAASIRERIGSVIDRADQPHYAALINTIQAELSQAIFQENWDAGGRQSVEQAVAFALRPA